VIDQPYLPSLVLDRTTIFVFISTVYIETHYFDSTNVYEPPLPTKFFIDVKNCVDCKGELQDTT
jgi:hypothetical protein